MPDKLSDKLADVLINQTPDGDSGIGKTALVTGSVALGAYLTGTVLRLSRRSMLPHPQALAPALDADIRELELMEGRSRYYIREGEGVPIVLLHSFNAAASSFEIKPIFDHLAQTTQRPLYALEWFGFGRSDRPPVYYHPTLYLRQLRRFLSEILHDPADIVALSLATEYAAVVATEAPVLMRRLTFISPTGFSGDPSSSFAQKALLALADRTGAYELFFYRLTRPQSLRDFYQRQVFIGAEVPTELVEYAHQTSNVRGAHFAPRRFTDGTLFLGERARQAYEGLTHPTLLTLPERPAPTVQSFEKVDELSRRNPVIQTLHIDAGLLPQWDAPEALFPSLDAFLNTEDVIANGG